MEYPEFEKELIQAKEKYLKEIGVNEEKNKKEEGEKKGKKSKKDK